MRLKLKNRMKNQEPCSMSSNHKLMLRVKISLNTSKRDIMTITVITSLEAGAIVSMKTEIIIRVGRVVDVAKEE